MFGLNTRKIGNSAEEKAADFLKKKGYQILAKNFTIRGGEIDIVAKDGEELVFVEVKMRSGILFGSAAESVTSWKLRALRKTALFYIQKINWGERPYRFDLVTIDLNDGTSEINLIKNILS